MNERERVMEWMRDRRLTAYDFKPDQHVHVVHCDGSVMEFASAFAVFHDGWLCVFTEHQGYHAFHPLDLTRHHQATITTDLPVVDDSMKPVPSARCTGCRTPTAEVDLKRTGTQPDEDGEALCPNCLSYEPADPDEFF